jgi:putative ABC transport system ATP-binding protein
VSLEGPEGPRLRDVTGAIPDGCLTVVVGPSGAGKSTLLRLCNRLELPTSGNVSFRGDDVARLDPLALRRRVGMVFQRPSPFAGTVLDNLRVARAALTPGDATQLLERAALDESFLDRSAGELSGGEAQRLCLARTLATDPEVLCMDEPTASLDHRSRGVLEELARGLVDRGVPVVWVTHDFAQMRRIAHHVLVFDGGWLVHAAPIDALDATAPPAVARFLDDLAAHEEE